MSASSSSSAASTSKTQIEANAKLLQPKATTSSTPQKVLLNGTRLVLQAQNLIKQVKLFTAQKLMSDAYSQVSQIMSALFNRSFENLATDLQDTQNQVSIQSNQVSTGFTQVKSFTNLDEMRGSISEQISELGKQKALANSYGYIDMDSEIDAMVVRLGNYSK